MQSFWPQQKCPLCENIARYRGIEERKKYFKCPDCHDFVIPQNREETISKLKKEIREDLSKKSAALKKEFALLIYFFESVEGTLELRTEITPRDRWIP